MENLCNDTTGVCAHSDERGSFIVMSRVALYIPLRRANSVDCTVALREE
jgi:hypothetical protein